MKNTEHTSALSVSRPPSSLARHGDISAHLRGKGIAGGGVIMSVR